MKSPVFKQSPNTRPPNTSSEIVSKSHRNTDLPATSSVQALQDET